ncbi:hypothetical protein [Methylobacterium sp. E-066]|uniref:hypothetical protein n=1 Tax=Methylobacterium sp. E-066 TaxID=2836584 RepID=UPI001FBB36DA|nr:hypothetical protein [Methylobacterium sp. E-066]MCJ2139650.1 hypothetical protein [Methylobacterium sp. E-066]
MTPTTAGGQRLFPAVAHRQGCAVPESPNGNAPGAEAPGALQRVGSLPGPKAGWSGS